VLSPVRREGVDDSRETATDGGGNGRRTLRFAAARSDLSAVVGATVRALCKEKAARKAARRTKSDDDQIIVSASRRLPFNLFKTLVVIANHLGSDPHRVFDDGL